MSRFKKASKIPSIMTAYMQVVTPQVFPEITQFKYSLPPYAELLLASPYTFLRTPQMDPTYLQLTARKRGERIDTEPHNIYLYKNVQLEQVNILPFAMHQGASIQNLWPDFKLNVCMQYIIREGQREVMKAFDVATAPLEASMQLYADLQSGPDTKFRKDYKNGLVYHMTRRWLKNLQRGKMELDMYVSLETQNGTVVYNEAELQHDIDFDNLKKIQKFSMLPASDGNETKLLTTEKDRKQEKIEDVVKEYVNNDLPVVIGQADEKYQSDYMIINPDAFDAEDMNK
jgi:uncharacterized protein YrzB (UPF0473 family)